MAYQGRENAWWAQGGGRNTSLPGTSASWTPARVNRVDFLFTDVSVISVGNDDNDGDDDDDHYHHHGRQDEERGHVAQELHHRVLQHLGRLRWQSK